MATWSPEVVVDEALARALVAEFPETAGRPLRLLSTGWDRTVWLVDERWAFGFPRREVVVPGLERELAWLPRLAPLLPRPVPRPAFVGTPSEAFPWPFYGYELLPGVEPGDAPLDRASRLAVALELAAFLRALHAIDAGDLPPDGNARADMRTRVPKTRESLAEIERAGLWSAPPEVEPLLAAAESLADLPEPGTVAHGDLHFRHLLVDRGRLGGVIDWIDICRGDPAIDLMALWFFVPADDRPAFLDAYGDASDDRLLRARVISLNLCAVLAAYARASALPAIEREALAGLERTVAG